MQSRLEDVDKTWEPNMALPQVLLLTTEYERNMLCLQHVSITELFHRLRIRRCAVQRKDI